MTDSRPGLDPVTRDADAVPVQPSQRWDALLADTGAWHAGSLLVTGALVFGALGWWVGASTGWPWLTGVGVLAGAGLAVRALWVRYGGARLTSAPTRTSGPGAGGPPSATRPSAPRPSEDAP